ncbi:MAG: hypothetical protein J6Q78_06780 [Clostridia bacterium]|nr:hypothetical protein [Clostridia bacterium]
MTLGKICKISGIILGIFEVVIFCVEAILLEQPILVFVGFFIAYFTILFMLICGEAITLLDSIHSRIYMINYTTQEIVDKTKDEQTPVSYVNTANQQKVTWVCKECGTGNYQNNLYCRNCGKYK